MTLEQVLKLDTGDKVYWTDPDDDLASREYVIETIEVVGDIVSITESDGSHLSCFADELSLT